MMKRNKGKSRKLYHGTLSRYALLRPLGKDNERFRDSVKIASCYYLIMYSMTAIKNGVKFFLESRKN